MAGSGNGQVIRGAVVGYGGAFNMGRHHASIMNDLPSFKLSAVCDVAPERTRAALSDFPGIAVTNSVDELCQRGDVDLVTVVTPHNTHCELAVKCLRAGKHVVVEKPMCITTREADEMILASKESGRMLSVYHNRRWDADYLAVKDVMKKGLLGDVFHVDIRGEGYHRPGNWWRSDKVISGGAFYDWGAHIVDWILNIVGAPVRNVTGFIQKRVWTEVTNEDHVHSLIGFENGAVGEAVLSSIVKIPGPGYRVLGTRGGLVKEGKALKVVTDVQGFPAELRVDFGESDWSAYYRGIAAHLLDGAELEVTPESARRVISVIEATEESARLGKSVAPRYV